MKTGNSINYQKLLRVMALLGFLLSLNLSGQKLTLEPRLSPSLYAHGSNYFRFAIEGVPCDSIWIITNNGRLEKDSCWLNIERLEVGETSISFYNVSNNDTIEIETRRFRVVNIPLPQATLYKRISGVLSKKALLGSRGLDADYTDWQIVGCGVSAIISSYRVLVLRGDSLVGTMNVEAAQFTDDVKSIFEKMESGDKVYFMDIWATSPLGDSIKLVDVSFGVQ